MDWGWRPEVALPLAIAVVVYAVALLGLDDAAHERFLAHMVQHVLVMMVGVPPLLLADPPRRSA